MRLPSHARLSVTAFVLAAILLATAGLWAGGTAHALDALPPQHAPVPASEQGQPESDYDPEANLPYLFAVYIITWGGFFAYAWVMSRRQRDMERDLKALKTALAERDGVSGSPLSEGEG